MLLKCCTQYVSKFGNSTMATGLENVQFSFQSQRKTMPKNVEKLLYHCTQFTCQQGNAQNLEARLQQHVNQKFPDVQTGFRKGRGTNCQHPLHHGAREFQKNFYFIDCAKASNVQITTNCGKFLEMGLSDHLYLSSEKPVCKSKSNSQNQTWNNGLL